MPTPTYVALAKTVLTGSQTSVTFSSIPSTYTDLLLSMSVRGSRATTNEAAYLLFSGTSVPESSWSYTEFYGFSASISSDRFSNYGAGNILALNGSSTTANTFSNIECYLPNYSGSANKVVNVTGVVEDNNANGPYIYSTALLKSNTASISNLYVVIANGNFVSGSRFDLYGIKNS